MSIFFTLKQKFWKLWFFLCPKSATYLGLYLPLHGNNWQLLVWVVCSSSPHNDDGDDSAFFLAKIKCFSRCWTPLPQVTEHGLQAPKSDHSHSIPTSTSAILDLKLFNLYLKPLYVPFELYCSKVYKVRLG